MKRKWNVHLLLYGVSMKSIQGLVRVGFVVLSNLSCKPALPLWSEYQHLEWDCSHHSTSHRVNPPRESTERERPINQHSSSSPVCLLFRPSWYLLSYHQLGAYMVACPGYVLRAMSTKVAKEFFPEERSSFRWRGFPRQRTGYGFPIIITPWCN